MRLGFVLPHVGPLAGPDAIAQVAARAEEVGYDTLWVSERSLWPLEPKTPYPLGALALHYRTVLDPLETLTFAAARTERIGLGTNVLNLPWYSPVLLARRLTTLDVLSRGRLRVGVGIGWSEDEHDVAQSDFATRGARFEEAMAVLKAIWTTDPVEFRGEHYAIPRSFIGPKPVQRPHPPLYVGAFAPVALDRVARIADGWVAAGGSLEQIGDTFAGLRRTAAAAGREPDALALIVRAHVDLRGRPLLDGREPFAGSPEQIAGDLAASSALGAAEVCLDVVFDPAVTTVADAIDRLERLHRLARG